VQPFAANANIVRADREILRGRCRRVTHSHDPWVDRSWIGYSLRPSARGTRADKARPQGTEDEMARRSALLIAAAAIGVMALGVQAAYTLPY
jgi:hypothetical protein